MAAQRDAVAQYIAANSGRLIAEFNETVSGRRKNRPGLEEALSTCRIRRATLVVARLDRLSRSVAFVSALSESKQDFVIVDFPDANKFTIHVLAAIAEYESSIISERLKDAFAAAKARGVILGKPKGTKFNANWERGIAASAQAKKVRAQNRARDLAPIVWDMVVSGIRQPDIAEALSEMGIRTPRGGRWSRTAVGRIIKRTRSELGADPKYRTVRELGSRLVRMHARDAEVAPLVWKLRSQGKLVMEIADELNRLRVVTPRNRGWTRTTVNTFLRRTAQVFLPLQDSLAAVHPASQARSPLTEGAKKRALPVAALAWGLRSRGLSLAATVEEFNRRHIAPLRGPWSRWNVRNVLALTAADFPEEAKHAPLRRRQPSQRTP